MSEIRGVDIRSEYPRDLATRVLTRVLSDQQTLEEALRSSITTPLPPMQRAWLLEVTSGTLRWKGRLDLILDSIALKKKPSGWLRKTLLIAAYQLIAQDRTPAGRVVSETVNEVKEKEGEAPSRFANALLRKVADQAPEWRSMPDPEDSSAEERARWASLPLWLWQKWKHERGEAWLRDYAIASLERPPLWLRTKPGSTLGDVPGWVAGPVAGSGRVDFSGVTTAVPEMPGFAEGNFFVQDLSSQILVAEIAELVREQLKPAKAADVRALDLCAAPGGKAMGLAWEGFSVTASDRDPDRMVRLRENIHRVAPGVQVASLAELGEVAPTWDLVWVDAPCTGSGILRRHPEVRWLRQESDLKYLEKTQRELIASAWARVRPGGMFAYSVCSRLESEGPRHFDSRPPGGGAPLLTGDQECRRWALGPAEAMGGDGFWGILLRKQA